MGEGKNLKKLLKRLHVSVKELATKAGVPATTLYSAIQRDSTIKNSITATLADVSGEDFLRLLSYIKMGDYDPTSDPVMQRLAAEDYDEKTTTIFCESKEAEEWTLKEQDEINTFKAFLRFKRGSGKE